MTTQLIRARYEEALDACAHLPVNIGDFVITRTNPITMKLDAINRETAILGDVDGDTVEVPLTELIPAMAVVNYLREKYPPGHLLGIIRIRRTPMTKHFCDLCSVEIDAEASNDFTARINQAPTIEISAAFRTIINGQTSHQEPDLCQNCARKLLTEAAQLPPDAEA